MQRNFDVVMTQFDGKPFFLEDGVTQMTLGKCCFMATSMTMKGDEGLDLNAKLRLYKLSEQSFRGGVVDITAEDVATLKERAARAFGSFVLIGRIVVALETDYVPS
jgi:hypothetical protein